MVRADVGYILSRTTNVITPLGLIILFIVCIKYMEESKSRNILLGLCITISIILGMSNLDSLDGKLQYSYNISSDKFTYITDDDVNSIANLGRGFAAKGLVDGFKTFKSITDELLSYDPNLSFLGLDYEQYYILNLKTCAQPSFLAIKSLSATKETIDIIKKEHPVIFAGLGSVSEYYLYYWLLQSDQYEYSSRYNAFLPKELISKIDTYTKSDNRKSYMLANDCGKIANSLGKSKDTLMKNVFGNIAVNSVQNMAKSELITTEATKDTAATITKTSTFVYDLSEKLDGKNADFMYLKLNVDSNKIDPNINNNNPENVKSKLEKFLTKDTIGEEIKVTISWDNDYDQQAINYITCICGDGNLIIPLGSNLNWLLNSHKQVTIKVSGLSQDGTVIVNDIKFLQSDAKTLLN